MDVLEVLNRRRTEVREQLTSARDRGRSILDTEPEQRTEAMVAEARTLPRQIRQLERDLDDVEREIAAETAERDRRTAAAAARRASGTVEVPSVADMRREPATRAASAPAGPTWVRTTDRQTAVVGREARFAEHPVVAGYARARAQAELAVVGQHGGIANFVRAMTTTSGTAIVPTIWAGQIIDRARNQARVIQAGAEIVPMDSKQVQIGRLTGDPTAAFRTEGSTITASDPTFDNVTLDAKTMSCLVVGSMEWFQDAPNADQLVIEAIGNAMALQLDLVSLYGSITTGAGTTNLPTPPNPRGVLGALLALAPSSVLGGATNGTVQAVNGSWNEIVDLLFTVRDYNEEPTALIWNSKLGRQYAKAVDSQGQPLRLPPAIEDVQRLMTNQIPSYTQGTMTSRATDAFAGDWRQLLIGQRLELSLQVLTERYAENGQIGIVAHWRGDVQVARPRAFAVYRALQGA